MRTTIGLFLLASVIGIPLALTTRAADESVPAFTPLFNGKDLTGWDTWLGKPHKSVAGLELKKNNAGDYVDPLGLNNDPTKVYTVTMVDGAPAIRVSGQVFGAITSKQEFENYHLRLQFKWGDKRWPPRETVVRDSGLLYHCVGEHGAGGGFWMQSLESQIQEHDCGDFWSVAGAIVDVKASEKGKSLVYDPKGDKRIAGAKGTPTRIIKSIDAEKPTGEWNTMEIYCVGPTCVHVVNGKVNMVMTNPRRLVNGQEQRLTKGKVQLQSEGAEVFYRQIEWRPIDAIPESLLK